MGFWSSIGGVLGGIAKPIYDFGKSIFTRKNVETAAGIGAVAAPIIGATISANSAKKINEESQAAADELFAKQKQETDTSHVREVEDLKAAGLNPILSARYGGAASATGSMPSLTQPYKDAGRDFASASQISLNRKATFANIKNTKAMTLLNSANALKSREQAIQARLVTERMRTSQPSKTSIGSKYFLWPVREALDTINPLRGMFK